VSASVSEDNSRTGTATTEAGASAVRLTDLPVGAEARLHAADLDAQTRSLLRALGLTDASRVRVCKRGEPFIVQVRETRIGISKIVADQMLVVPIAAPAAG
jgi:Fe2+ transport system protein FeoA